MMRLRSLASALCAALLLVPAAFAADFAPPEKDKALEAVKQVAIDAAKGGKKADVWVKVFGKSQRVPFVSANGRNVTVKVEGNNFDQPWDKLAPDQVYNLMKPLVAGDAKGAIALADYCMASELGRQADDALAIAAQADPKADLKDRFAFVKTLPGMVATAPAAAAPSSSSGSSGGSSEPAPYAAPAKVAFTPSAPGKLADARAVAAAIDNAIEIELADMGIRPAPLADNATFLRRVYLDICGQIPSPEEVIEFYGKPSSVDVRAKKIEELLAKPEYADNYAIFWNSLLVGRRTRDDANVKTAPFRSWLREQLAYNAPYDKMVTEILTATGDNDKSGPANYLTFHMDDTLPNTMAHLTQTFLGARIGCAQCHDHPFDKWSQQDFWGFAAFLANTRSERREKREDPQDPTRVTYSWHVLTDQNDRNGGGRYDPPQNDLKVKPKFLDGPVFEGKRVAAKTDAKATAGGMGMKGDMKPEMKPGMKTDPKATAKGDMKGDMKDPKMAAGMKDGGMMGDMGMGMMGGTLGGENGELGLQYRHALAKWVTSQENEKFSQSVVNRIWRNMFGYGLVEPIDDIRPKNPPSHPEAMRILVEDFNASGRDLKRLIAVIANTRAYQRASNGSLDKLDRHKAVRYAARAEVRPMTPEMLFGAILKSTGGEERAKALSQGLRSRDQAMMSGNMAGMGNDVNEYYQLMQRFINTSTAEDRAGKLQFEGTVSQSLMMMHSGFMNNSIKNGIARYKKKGQGDMVYIFAATLGRPPTPTESSAFANFQGGLEGIMWILLNSAEFVTIH